MTWFNVDKEGLAAQMAERPRSSVIYELIANAWDSGTPGVEVRITPIDSSPFAAIEVEDWGDGFADLATAYTMYAPSNRADHPNKRGRFCIGEKLALSLCRRAEIVSTGGSIRFDEKGRHQRREARERGTLFRGELRMTRDELAAALSDLTRLIPPVPTRINGTLIEASTPIKAIDAKLPGSGTVKVELRDGPGEVLELGIPVVEAEIGFRCNVLGKTPLNRDRDNVTPAWLRALRVAVVNAMAGDLTSEQSAEAWVQEAAGDSRIAPDAIKRIVQARFGDRAVVAVPGDPIANANAEAHGFTVVHGGAMSSGQWANVRKHAIIPAANVVFPTPTAEEAAASREAMPAKCPLCGRSATTA